MKKTTLIIIVLLVVYANGFSQLPAFPGAEGFGAHTRGGRGGRIIEVTSLEDSGPGTLRQACGASGPRIVVFKTGGMIELKSKIEIRNPNITIAGQTAPGDGICLKLDQNNLYSSALMGVGADEVIIRFLRFRRGPGTPGECCGDALVIANNDAPVANVIVDHCSFSWGTDELINTWYEVSDVTVQNCIASEALHQSTHGTGHSKGPFFGDSSTRISLYRTYIAHNVDRSGYFVFDKAGQTGLFECVNNVIFNWIAFGNNYQGRFGASLNANVIGNYFIAGRSTWTHRYEMGVGENDSPEFSTQIYVRGNIGPHRRKLTDSEWRIVGYDVNYMKAAPEEYRAESPFDTPLAGTTQTHEDAYDYVIERAGAFARLDENGEFIANRDTTDARVINDVVTRRLTTKNSDGYYGIVDHPDDVGGWATYEAGTPYVDSDNDGMADVWEVNHFGDLETAKYDDTDKTDFDNDGYPDFEEFLNAEDPKRMPERVENSSVKMPADFSLTAFPNPFNPTTTIVVSMPQAGHVTLSVYDITGKKVDELLNDEYKPKGEFRYVWNSTDADGRKFAAGIYSFHLKTELHSRTIKATLLP